MIHDRNSKLGAKILSALSWTIFFTISVLNFIDRIYLDSTDKWILFGIFLVGSVTAMYISNQSQQKGVHK